MKKVLLIGSQRATVLAALRYYQQKGLGDPANRPLDIHDIATDCGDVISLDDKGIDELCEELNVADDSQFCEHDRRHEDCQLHGGAVDSTWRDTVNGEPRDFHPTLDAAIAFAIRYKKFADLTNQQAAEYIRRFPLTDNQNEPHELWRNILDCGCHDFNGHRFSELEDGEECYCGVKYEDAEEPCPIENHFCFTTVVDDDLEEDDYEDPSDYVHGWECFRVEPNDQYKVKA